MPRNASGVYTLPAGNPVEPGTTIDAAWANDTLEDMANEITNSLSRTGAGGMIAPFRIADGVVTAPGLAYTNETNSGLYRSGAGSVWMSILGVNVAQFSTVGLTIPFGKALTAQGNASVSGTLAVTGATTLSSTLAVTGAITATGGVVGNVTGNVTAASGTSTFNNVTISGSLDMDAGSSATITGLADPVNASDAANKGYVDAQCALKLSLTGGTMSGAIAMGTNRITGLGNPSSAQDAATKTYVDSADALKLSIGGGTMFGPIAMGTYRITGMGDPVADQDAATKSYVDTVAQGLDAKASCVLATTTNITLSGIQTVDGVTADSNDRVLVKDQTNQAQNGIYVVNLAGAWTRSADANTWQELVAAYTFIEKGNTNANNGYVCTIPASGTLGTTPVTWAQFSGAGQIDAGAGLTKTGNQLNVGTASSSRIVVNSDNIDLATTGVSASTYKSVTVDAYGRVTAGTNPTTLSGFGITDAYTQTQTNTLLAAKLSLSGGTMTGLLNMNGYRVVGLAAPADPGDAANQTYVDTGLALKLNLTGGTMSGAIAMGANKITGMADPTNPQDAATKSYIDTIFGSTTTAAASAAAAASSASAAATSASNAATSASSAATSATNAADSYTTFNNQYLGSKTSDPSTNNTGGALVAGNLYWNSTAGEMRVYSGSAWQAAYLPATGYLALSGGTMTGNLTFNNWTTSVQGSMLDAPTYTATGPSYTELNAAFSIPDGSLYAQDNGTGAAKFLKSILSGTAYNAPLVVGAGTSGQTIISAGAGTIAAWGAVGVAGGGTGQTSYTTGDLLYASSSSALSKLADVATGNSLISGGVGVAPSWGKIGLTTHVSGTLPVANGGTGATTLTGIVKGNGTSAFTAATAGTDYVAPGTATTFTATQTFSGSSSTFATSLLDANETVNVVAAAPSATTNFYVQSGAVQYYTSNAANNWTLNIAFSAGTSLNTALATGKSVTFTLITTQSSTAYYANAITIDGTSVTPKWIGGAPTAGNASGLDVYRFAVVKTASATYTVLASLTQYK